MEGRRISKVKINFWTVIPVPGRPKPWVISTSKFLPRKFLVLWESIWLWKVSKCWTSTSGARQDEAGLTSDPQCVFSGGRVRPGQCPQLVWQMRHTSEHHLRHSPLPRSLRTAGRGPRSSFPPLRGECRIPPTFPAAQHHWWRVWKSSGDCRQDVRGLGLSIEVLVKSSLPLRGGLGATFVSVEQRTFCLYQILVSSNIDRDWEAFCNFLYSYSFWFLLSEIGVGLAGFGVAFLFLGVCLLFDKGLLAIGNVRSAVAPRSSLISTSLQILFLSGLACVIGLERTFRFFFQWHKARGSGAFFGGIVIVLFGWPIIGMCVELYGFVVLFR